jgi:hypothetical protein
MGIPLSEVVRALEANEFTPDISPDLDITLACASDLMSDVLSYSRAGSILLTGLTSPQSVRTAEIAEIVAICFVFGKKPQKDTVGLAHELDIPLIGTAFSLYTASGLLYSQGIKGCYETKDE